MRGGERRGVGDAFCVDGRAKKLRKLDELGMRAALRDSVASNQQRSLRRDGAIWVIYPKGRKDIREVDVIRAGVEAGYVDNKIVRFSDSHTAMRLVIPLSRR